MLFNKIIIISIVLSRKCQYPYRPPSKMPVRVSSLVENASTCIVLSQKCQYAYRPQSKMPVRVLSLVENASTRIVLSQKCQYAYRHTHTDTGVTDVPVMAICQYGHGRIKDRTRIVLVKNASTRTSRPVPAQACCAYGYLHICMYVWLCHFSYELFMYLSL
jgi:hypothetical protein